MLWAQVGQDKGDIVRAHRELNTQGPRGEAGPSAGAPGCGRESRSHGFELGLRGLP